MTTSPKLISVFLLFFFSCAIDPSISTETNGPCYAGLEQFEDLLKEYPPVVTCNDLTDTLCLDSLYQSFPVQIQYQLQSQFFGYGKYKISFDGLFYYEYDTIPNTSSEFTTDYDIIVNKSKDTASIQFQFNSYPVNSLFNEFDILYFDLYINLSRYVDGLYCNSTKIQKKRIVVIRRVQNDQGW